MKNLKQKSFLIFTACMTLIIGCTQVNYDNPVDLPPYGDGSEPGDTETNPSITLDSDTIQIYTDQPVENQLPGYTVEDEEDDVDSLKVTHDAPDVYEQESPNEEVVFVVTDSDGMTGRDTLTVVVEKNEGHDIYPPEIYINGSDPYSLTIGESYDDPGADATDVNAEGDTVSLSDRIEVTGISDINNTTEGDYIVTYSVEDDAGQSDSTTRTVRVIDTSEVDEIAPVIELNGDDPITLSVGDEFSDPGATASDNRDGSLTDSIKVSGEVDTSVEGSYTLTYTVSDKAGNQAQETRTVLVEDDTTPTDTGDTIAPVIQLAGSSYVQVDLDSTWDDPGATATDINGDGEEVDLTESITVSGSVDSSTLGTYTLTYSVEDNAGNRTRVKRDVQVIDPNSTDTEPPVITLIDAGDGKGDTVVMVAGERYSEPGVSANDNEDGDISGRINVDRSNLQSSTAGTYHIVYTVSDNAGNMAEEKRTVIVEGDEDSPVINLEGANPCTVFVDETFAEPGYEAYDVIGGSPGPDLTDEVVVDRGEFDITTPGEYTFTYTVTDPSDNRAQEIRTVVVIADDLPPEITIEGDNPYTLLLDDDFTDPGASAVDNKDGEVEVVSEGTVDPSTEGEYTITYTAVDEAGNTATAERTVNVVTDVEPPELTLDGPDDVTVFVGEAYEEPGYSASDDMDGDITDQVVVDSGGFDTSVTGEYTFTYSVSDAAGNTDTAERTVNVSVGEIIALETEYTISEATTFILPREDFPTGDSHKMSAPLHLYFEAAGGSQIELSMTCAGETYEMGSPAWNGDAEFSQTPNDVPDSQDGYEIVITPESGSITFTFTQMGWW